MSPRGKFIVIEGIDGSGKRTQLELLARWFEQKGIAFAQMSFPNYAGFFGKLVARFLNGEFGSLEAVNPHFSALLYASDRLESKPVIEAALSAGKTVLSDRYVASNLAHQGARVPVEKRAEFLKWLDQLEYEVNALPREDLVLYLRVPPAQAQRLISGKGERDYTKLRHDLQESDLGHLEAASGVYDQLAGQWKWTAVECMDLASGTLRSPSTIQQEIVSAVETRIFSALPARW
jgi:dTMP kinase